MGDSRVGLLYFRSLGRALPLWNSDPEATHSRRYKVDMQITTT